MRHLSYTKNCKYCNKEFKSTRNDAVFCSDSCRSFIYRQIKTKLSDGGKIEEPTKIWGKDEIMYVLVCDQCKRKVTERIVVSDPRFPCCSEKCKTEWKNRHFYHGVHS